MKSVILFSFLFFCSFGLQAQDGSDRKFKDNLSINGYLKDLRSLYLFEEIDDWKVNSIIHQRTNAKYYLNDNFTFGAALRTQFIYGGITRTINTLLDDNSDLIDFVNASGAFGQIPKTYGGLLSANNTLLDFNFLVLDETDITILSQLDRLWLDYSRDKFQVRIGKQRVNWGVNWVWNPNDLFNTFNFTDFDYEERAASDAIRLQYYYGTVNKVEVVVAAGPDFEQNIYGLLWKTNKWNYDFQLLGANYQSEWVGGLGWSGNIANAGFKGEISYFFGDDDSDSDAGLVGSVSFDYAFLNGLILQAEILYNDFGQSDPEGPGGIGFAQTLSPKGLSQYKWSTFFGSAYTVSPRTNIGLAIILQPSDGAYYFAPNFSYSLGSNLDLFLIAQMFNEQSFDLFPGIESGLSSNFGLFNTRLKWSF